MNTSFTVTSEPTQSGVSFAPTHTMNSGALGAHETTGLLELSTQGKIAIALTTSDTSSETAEVIDYQKLATEHAELIAQGKNSVEIAKWIGEKFGISNWAQGAHHGEWHTLSTPEGDLTQLKAFLKRGLGIDWSHANGGSDNYPTFHLTDGYTLNALFGEQNMKKADVRNDELNKEWERLDDDYNSKAAFLKRKVGLDIKGDWSNLTGIRHNNGRIFVGSGDGLYASGSLLGVNVRRLGLIQLGSHVDFGTASVARLCFLA